MVESTKSGRSAALHRAGCGSLQVTSKNRPAVLAFAQLQERGYLAWPGEIALRVDVVDGHMGAPAIWPPTMNELLRSTSRSKFAAVTADHFAQGVGDQYRSV